MTDKVDQKMMQELVNCFASTEICAIDMTAQIANISKCLDTLARQANEAGVDVRAFQLGEAHKELGRMVSLQAKVGSGVMAVHQALYELAKDIDVPVPQPETGGR